MRYMGVKVGPPISQIRVSQLAQAPCPAHRSGAHPWKHPIKMRLQEIGTDQEKCGDLSRSAEMSLSTGSPFSNMRREGRARTLQPCDVG